VRATRQNPVLGMTLMEMMVVIALLGVVILAILPSFGSMMGLQRDVSVRKLASSYRFLHEEAALRNVSFRLAFNLDANSWTVEVGDPNTLIFHNQDDREEFESDLMSELSRYTTREIEEGKASEVTDQINRFDAVTEMVLHSLSEDLETREGRTAAVYLPEGTKFLWVQTAQYREPVTASPSPPEDPSEESIAYSMIFPNGTMEPTLIRVVDSEDEDDGVTILVEPLSGRVDIQEEEIELDDWLDWLPETGPELTL
jgi:prepilin-type N-terminal cleavage/methylation domain-containing protein